MISQEQIPDVLDHMVLDTEGKKIGEARHVFLDDRTGLPEWVTIRTGMFGSQETFVPIHEANLVEDHLEVPYGRTKVKDAPHIDVDQGHLSEQQEHELYDYYGVDWDTSRQRQGGEGEAGGEQRAEGAGARDTGAAAGAAGMAGAGTAEERRAHTEQDARGMAGRGEIRTDYERESGTQAEAMTRSEEEMRVHTERHESGRARLRKYVVTENVEQTVPLHHEEVRVEREPVTESNVDRARSGERIGEAEHEVVLHEDRPVAETETVPVERVRMVPEDHVEERTVRGEVRKERIDVEGVEGAQGREEGGGQSEDAGGGRS